MLKVITKVPIIFPDKADAIETVLRLLSDIDLPSICQAVMLDSRDVHSVDDIIALAARDQHMPFFPSKSPDETNVPGKSCETCSKEVRKGFY